MTGPESINSNCPSGQLPVSSTLPSNTEYMENRLAADVGPPLCVRCSLPIFDQFILQLKGQTWHSNCLRCSTCQMPLSQMCYSDNTQLYCQDDFFKVFGASCSRCNGIIAPTEIVRRAHRHIYHLGCFICSVCNCELRTGDEFYVSDDAHLFCKADYAAASDKQQDRLDDALDDVDIQLQTIKDVLENHGDDFSLEGADLSDDAIDKIAADSGMNSSAVRQLLQQKKKDDKKENNSTNSQQRPHSNDANIVHPPTNGYPLPIVNPVGVTGTLSGHPSTDLDQLQLNTTIKKHISDQVYLQSLEEFWPSDFMPPNVNLEPEYLQNGNVIAECLLSNQRQQTERSNLCAILSES